MHRPKLGGPTQSGPAGAAKTSAAYWLSKVKKPAGSGLYGVQIAYRGNRHRFPLETANQAAAAEKARKIYLSIVANGVEATLEQFNPKVAPKPAAPKTAVTVGELIEAARRLSPARWESLDTYAQALRRIVGAVNGWDGRTAKCSPEGSNDSHRARVDAVRLASITPAAVEEWRNAKLKSAESPQERNAAVVTTNSLIRNSKALVSRKIRAKLKELIQLPEVLWFHDVAPETPPSLRYKSKIDAGAILRAGMEELATNDPEALKCLLLTLVCGLRRSEADTLMWEQIDLQAGKLEVMDTVHKRLKSCGSAGEIALDPQVVRLLKTWHETKRGPFVLESTFKSGGKEKTKQFRRYRANHTHLRLLAWLRAKGVPSQRPLHLMRKEVGSVIASRDGIFAASRFLRHSNIAITSQLYADAKAPISSGLGPLLEPPKENVVQGKFKAAAANTEESKQEAGT